MIVVRGEATERRGLLVQFHEEDLQELRAALDAYEQSIHLDNGRAMVQDGSAAIARPVPEWCRRLDTAALARINDNRRSP